MVGEQPGKRSGTGDDVGLEVDDRLVVDRGSGLAEEAHHGDRAGALERLPVGDRDLVAADVVGEAQRRRTGAGGRARERGAQPGQDRRVALGVRRIAEPAAVHPLICLQTHVCVDHRSHASNCTRTSGMFETSAPTGKSKT